MESFKGKLAVVTGGGSGIGRGLVTQLAAAGCNVAFCDLSDTGSKKTLDLCSAMGVSVTAHACDVSSESDLLRFRDEITAQHATDHIDLLFNNAGVSGGQSFINDDRDQWDRTFAICWGGVYLGCRVFIPLLLKSEQAHIINISSVNGFWGCLGSETEHTAYSSAKFAVKGFTESLMVDLRINAPHIGVSVVMPGHIGTSIVANTQRMWQGAPQDMSAEYLDQARQSLARNDPNAAQLDDDAMRELMQISADQFRDAAPTTADEAATVILDGVLANQWRILIGDDARGLDAAVRADPEKAYDADFVHPFSIMDTE